MGNILPILFASLLILIIILMCWQESKRREINFFLALLLCILLTPIIAYFVIIHRPLRIKRFCWHCNNTKSETKKCGVCGGDTEEVKLHD
jgi:hypothetical protein